VGIQKTATPPIENNMSKHAQVGCDAKRSRARALSIAPGILPTGHLNTITDVHPVRVGQVTMIEGEDIRTGATATLPH
jgi:D-aminopeptidase